VISLKYANLNVLLSADNNAQQYFKSLPKYVQDQISDREDNINSLDSLKDYAENLLRGDD